MRFVWFITFWWFLNTRLRDSHVRLWESLCSSWQPSGIFPAFDDERLNNWKVQWPRYQLLTQIITGVVKGSHSVLPWFSFCDRWTTTSTTTTMECRPLVSRHCASAQISALFTRVSWLYNPKLGHIARPVWVNWSALCTKKNKKKNETAMVNLDTERTLVLSLKMQCLAAATGSGTIKVVLYAA